MIDSFKWFSAKLRIRKRLSKSCSQRQWFCSLKAIIDIVFNRKQRRNVWQKSSKNWIVFELNTKSREGIELNFFVIEFKWVLPNGFTQIFTDKKTIRKGIRLMSKKLNFKVIQT